MTDNLWTKGPWHVGDDDEGFDGVEYIQIHAGEYSHSSFRDVAHIQAGFDGTNHVPLAAEDWANAHLIASAPETHDAAELARDVIEAILTSVVLSDRLSDMAHEAHDKLTAALLKARVESSHE